MNTVTTSSVVLLFLGFVGSEFSEAQQVSPQTEPLAPSLPSVKQSTTQQPSTQVQPEDPPTSAKPHHYPNLLQYREVKVYKIEPDGVRILHSTGATKIGFEALPKELQVKYGFNSEIAATYREQTSELRSQQIESARLKKLIEGKQIKIGGHILQVLNDGVLLRSAILTTIKDPMIAKADWKPVHKLIDEVVFVKGDSRNHVDGEMIHADVWDIGQYQYTNTQGAVLTVRQFTTDADTAATALDKATVKSK